MFRYRRTGRMVCRRAGGVRQRQDVGWQATDHERGPRPGNDAGEAASGVIAHLESAWEAVPIAELDPDEYYDFQVTRPIVEMTDGETRGITWPTTRMSWARLPNGKDVVLLHGIEPNLRWRS